MQKGRIIRAKLPYLIFVFANVFTISILQMYNIFLYELIFLKTQNLSTSMFFIISYNRIFMKHLFLQIVFISIPEKYDPVPWTQTLGNHGTMLFHLKEEPLTSYTHTRFILD